MSYFGAYMGGEPEVEETVEEAGPAAIVAEVSVTAPTYVNHYALALSRLPQYARAKSQE